MSPRHYFKKIRPWSFFKGFPNYWRTVADPGPGGSGPAPLIIRPNWGPKGREISLGDLGPHLSKGLDDRGLPLSQGLDPALPNDDVNQYVDDITPSKRSCDVYGKMTNLKPCNSLYFKVKKSFFISSGAATDNYMVAEGQSVPKASSSLSRADLAHFMLKSLQSNEWDKKGMAIAGGK